MSAIRVLTLLEEAEEDLVVLQHEAREAGKWDRVRKLKGAKSLVRQAKKKVMWLL